MFKTMKKILFLALMLVSFLTANAQVGIGTTNPHASSILDLTSNSKGLLVPRMDTTDRNNIASPANGLTIFNTDEQCYNFYDLPTTTWKSICSSGGANPTITGLTCASTTQTGNVIAGQLITGSPTLTVPYTGGNGGAYAAGSAVTASGGTVTGLTLTLQAGNLANGAGSLIYTIAGTPSGVGNAIFTLSFGGQVCGTATVTASAAPSVATLTCTTTQTGTLYVGTAASGVTFTVPYTGGNGSAYNAGTAINSSGVTGLQATLVAGTLANGAGTLTYNVTGTPSGSGLATFNLTFGGANCAGASVSVFNSGSSSALVDNYAFGGFGGQQAFAVCSDGGVLSQGYNESGMLGTGNAASTASGSNSSFNVVGFDVNNKATAVAGGTANSYFLRADNTVWAAGNRLLGALGDNQNAAVAVYTPTQVKGVGNVGFLTDVAQIAAGYYAGYAIKTDGTAFAWGYNANGQLGDNTTTDRLTPVQIKGVGGSGFLTGVTYITSALYNSNQHTCAVRNDGSAFCWGDNSWGQLGDASQVAISTPKQVRGPSGIGNLSNVKTIAVNVHSSAALLNDGTVYAWGENNYGQLGQNNASPTRNITPLQVKGVGGTGVLTGIVDLKSYEFGYIALKSDGTVYSWGYGNYGTNGTGEALRAAISFGVRQVVGVGGVGFLTGITSIQGGFRAVGAVGAGGVMYGWGDNTNHNFAPSTTAYQATPVALPNFCTVN